MSAEYEPFKPFTASSAAEDAEALRLEVSHVQASGVLGEARLRRMFDYLAERSLAGQSPKEIAIAIDVFGKSPDFDVSQDALVRVYIHKLRKALDEYYSSAGGRAAELHIPRGEYRLKVSAKAPVVVIPAPPPQTPRLSNVHRITAALIGAAVLVGFALGVISSTLLGGNAYMLKVRDGFFTLLFGVACIVTLYTHDRPALFYVSRYLSAGKDPDKISAFDRLHELPIGRHTFRLLSVVWGIGLVVEASARLTLADVLPTGTFLAVSPFITATVIGGLFAFTAAYVRRARLESAALMARIVHDAAAEPSPDHTTDPHGPGPNPGPGSDDAGPATAPPLPPA